MDLSKTLYYDSLRRDGASVLKKTLTGANGQEVIGEIARDVEQMLNGMAKGIHLGKGQFTETADLVRLIGYIQEVAKVVGVLPIFGFDFRVNEFDLDTGKSNELVISFNPTKLDPELGRRSPAATTTDPALSRAPVGLEKVGS